MFHMMGHLGCQGDAAVDVATQTDGDELIGVRGEILAFDGLSVAHIPIFYNCRVEAQRTMIVADGSESEVLDMQRAEGLEKLRVRPLHIVLQRVGELIVLIEERLADLRNPLVGILVQTSVHGLARPQGDVVQIDDVVVCASIDQCSELAVADGQRLFEKYCRLVILQHHRCLLLCCQACRGKQAQGE